MIEERGGERKGNCKKDFGISSEMLMHVGDGIPSLSSASAITKISKERVPFGFNVRAKPLQKAHPECVPISRDKQASLSQMPHSKIL